VKPILISNIKLYCAQSEENVVQAGTISQYLFNLESIYFQVKLFPNISLMTVYLKFEKNVSRIARNTILFAIVSS